MYILSLDTETTGVDFNHGAMPFFVTMCDSEGRQTWWEWIVDPVTRLVDVKEEDLDEIFTRCRESDTVVMQNGKFDYHALRFACRQVGKRIEDYWDWDKVEDTLIAGHLLASNKSHDLTSMAMMYLGIDLLPYEKKLEEAVKECRRLVKKYHLDDYKITKEGLAETPSATKETWRYDYWLPKAMYSTVDGEDIKDEWETVLRDYANADSATTILLWQRMEQDIKRRKLWKIYRSQMMLPRIIADMETVGVSMSKAKLTSVHSEFETGSVEANRKCEEIALDHNYDLSLPKTGSNKSLSTFIFDVLKLPVVKTSKQTGKPSLDKNALNEYLNVLDTGSQGHEFIECLLRKRKLDTHLAYVKAYERYWVADQDAQGKLALRELEKARKDRAVNMVWIGPEWYKLYPSFNQTGSDTLRFSSNNPNSQNVGKGDDVNLRKCFGPAPGREWWSCDAKNIELRIPAYISGEEEMIALFERPDDPPYFGSNHLLVSHILYPKEFEECRDDKGKIDGRIFKKRYASTLYQWVKNGNFAVQYGSVESSGTADRAYHLKGAQRKVQDRFTKSSALNRKLIEYADKYGYVETLPDKSVDPDRGYPILCSRTEWGRVLPTVPLNYFVQGSAMWWMRRAMVRCWQKIQEWNTGKPRDEHIHMVMQIHDELVFDFPRKAHPKEDIDRSRPDGMKLYRKSNLWRIKVLQKLMEQGGYDIGVPTPTSCEYHAENWAVGESF